MLTPPETRASGFSLFALCKTLLPFWLFMASIPVAVAAAGISVVVDPAQTLVALQGRPYGINVNFLKDDDHLRPDARPLSRAITEMGAGWIRYPGGEKSDWQLWAQPPYASPEPVVHGYYQEQLSDPLNFDEYMALVKSTGAQPFVVVGYDSPRTGFKMEDYLRSAVEWVRYANITKKYGVKFWEIGNENWNNGTGSPEAVAKAVAEISRAMKAVDPTIKTGASGNGSNWWRAYLAADPHIDFFTVSNYTGTAGGYAAYAKADSINLLRDAESAFSALDEIQPASGRDGKSVIIAEFNSKDWTKKGGWGDGNNLGHALMNFETLGQILLEPRLTCGMFWTTRWMNWQKPDSLFYALDAKNGLLPQGRILAIWGRFLRERMVQIGSAPGLVTYASASTTGDRVTIFLMNKRAEPVGVDVTTLGAAHYTVAESFRFMGKDESDPNPSWNKISVGALASNRLEPMVLPGLSITVVSLHRQGISK